MMRPRRALAPLFILALVAACEPPEAITTGGDVAAGEGGETNPMETASGAIQAGLSTGYLDIVTVTGNQVRVQGWAISQADPNASAVVHFYANAPASRGGTYVGAARTTVFRGDVNQVFGVTGTHGYDFTWTGHPVVCAPGTRALYVHVIDQAGNPVVGSKSYSVALTQQSVVHFDSSAAWPPAFSNNPSQVNFDTTQPAGRYIAPFFGRSLAEVAPLSAVTTVSTPAAFTGLNVPTVTEYSPLYVPAGFQKKLPFSFVQLDHQTKTLGIWLNSQFMDGFGGLTAVTPGARLSAPVRPWAQSTSKLSLSWNMRVPRVERDDTNLVFPYVVGYVIIRLPSRGLGLWYGSSVYDSRGYSRAPTYMAYDRATKMGIYTERLSASATSLQPGPNSYGMQWVPYSDEKYFDITVSRAQLRSGLARYNQYAASAGAPQWPLDDASLAAVEVTMLALDPQVADFSNRQRVPDANGRLGVTIRDLRLRTVLGDGSATPAPRPAPVQLLSYDGSSPRLAHHLGRQEGTGWSATVFDRRGYLSYGPYATDWPGTTTAVSFDLVVDNNTADDAQVAAIDVYDATTGTVLAGRTLTRREMAAPNTPRTFSLGVSMANRVGHHMEARVYLFGNSYVRLQRIVVLGDASATPAPQPAPVQLLSYDGSSQRLAHHLGRQEGTGWSATVFDGRGYLSYGPYATDWPGTTTAVSFDLVVDNNTADDAQVAAIDVYDATTGTVLAGRTLTRREMAAPNTPRTFSLGVSMANRVGHHMEARVYLFGNSYVRLQRIVVLGQAGPSTN